MASTKSVWLSLEKRGQRLERGEGGGGGVGFSVSLKGSGGGEITQAKGANSREAGRILTELMDSVNVGMHLEGKWGRKQTDSLCVQDLSLGSEHPSHQR